MSEHAILPPSSAKEWGNCGGWLILNESTPEPPETDEARWGNECHALSEQMLRAHTRAGNGMPTCDDPEMLECAEMYANHCAEIMRRTGVFGGDNLGIESRVETDIPNVWGTVDFYSYHAAKRTLYVRDLKSGRLCIEPDDPQLLLYALGAMIKLGLSDLDTVIDIGVVQPRGYHRQGPIRTIRMWAHEMRPAINDLRVKAEANRARDKPAEAGQHCLNCKARTRCDAAIQSGQSLPYAVAEAVPAELSPVEAGLLLRNTRRAIKYLEKMEEAYAGEVEGHVRAGRSVPGWAMTPQMSRSKEWTVKEQEVLQLGQLFGADLSKPGLITPTQAAKKGIPEEILTGYCTRRQTGVKLTESDDKSIANIFNGVK